MAKIPMAIRALVQLQRRIAKLRGCLPLRYVPFLEGARTFYWSDAELARVNGG